MRQQINLYQPIFSEARKPLSALTVAIVLSVLIVGLIAFSVHTGMRTKTLSAQVEALRLEQQAKEAELAAATELRTQRSNPAEIEARVKRLTTSLDERTRALQLLKSGAAGQTTGFAERLEALARRHVDGLWIDKLVISGTNGSMSLAGATLNADIVPTYLQSLAQEKVLSGTRFDEFMIERPTATKTVADADDATAESPKKIVAAKFIRFRAGNKALSSEPQASAWGDS